MFVVVGRLARCELVKPARPGMVDVGLVEFAVLDDGRRLAVRDDRGFSYGGGDRLERDDLENGVMNALLPDEPVFPGQVIEVDQEWQWVVDVLAGHGITETAAHYASLPVEIEFSPEILARLG